MRQPEWMNKVAEGTLCDIFTFLDLRNYCNWAHSCVKMHKISQHPQASPTKINLLEVVNIVNYRYSSQETKTRIIKRLMTFRPLKLIVPLDLDNLAKVGQMTSLVDLIFNQGLSQTGRPQANINWMHKLPRLTKLTIPNAHLSDTEPSPTSLTFLELVKSDSSGNFSTFNSTVYSRHPTCERYKICEY